jgi:predicted nuclease with TOPRIM domain
MKRQLKVFGTVFIITILLSSILVLNAAAQAPQQNVVRQAQARANADRTAAIRNEIENLRNAAEQAELDGRPDEADRMRREADNMAQQLELKNQQRPQQRQLREIDAEIERLRQMTQEAEQIRENIVRQSGQPQAQTPRRAQRPQPVQQVPPGTGAGRGARVQRPNPPIISRPGMRAIIDNIPQMVDQLRNALNNNIERIHTAYEKIQERLINLEEENERLRNENRELRNQNQDLRNQNQQLRARIQEREPRRPSIGERQSDTVERP